MPFKAMGTSVNDSNLHRTNGPTIDLLKNQVCPLPFPRPSYGTYEPVAIVGMAMRLPGGVHDPESFWKFLMEKRNGRCEVPADRYNIDAFYGPGKTGHVGSRYGHFLDDINLAELDTSFWTMSKAELERMDPQQSQMLEVTFECLQNAGAVNIRGSKVGCYVGVFGQDWGELQLKDTESSGMYRVTGYDDFMIANRISFEFGFQGPR